MQIEQIIQQWTEEHRAKAMRQKNSDIALTAQGVVGDLLRRLQNNGYCIDESDQ